MLLSGKPMTYELKNTNEVSLWGHNLHPQPDEVNFNPQVLPLDSVNGHVATCCAVASGPNPDVIQSAECETSHRNFLAVEPEMKILANCPKRLKVQSNNTL